MSETDRWLRELSRVLRVRHYSPATEKAYVAWVRRFLDFHRGRSASELDKAEIEAFLTYLAEEVEVASSTQNQALSALLLFYSRVVRRQVPWLDSLTRAQRIKRVPVVVLGDVCKHCNNGWMSNLERDVGGVLKPLLEAPIALGTSFDASQASILARWAFKTAIVRNRATNYRKIVKDEHFEHLCGTHQLPPHTFVDAALSRSDQGLSGLQSQTLTALTETGDQRAFEAVKDSIYNILLGVGPLLLRVVHCPLPGYAVMSNLGHDRFAVRLHPWRDAHTTLDRNTLLDDLYDFETSTFVDVDDDDAA